MKRPRAKALYTSGRQEVADRISAELSPLLSDRGVVIEMTALRKLTLPAGLQASIEQKLQAEQESQRMQFVLTREKQEAERKRIEADGIAMSPSARACRNSFCASEASKRR